MHLRLAGLLRAACALLALLGSACGLVDSLSQPEELSIRRFSATPDEVSADATVTLSWEVEGAESVQIDGEIGSVVAKGTHIVRPRRSRAYVLTARKGTSSATATVRVVVNGTTPTPTPSPTPTIDPTPTPTPTPTPSPTPTPGVLPAPTPTPTPSSKPSPSPGASPVAPRSCGPTASAAVGCGLVISYPARLGEGECLAINTVERAGACPPTFGTSQELAFTVTAGLDDRQIAWRRGAGSTNVVFPEGGALPGSGQVRVSVTELVLDSQTVIEIVRGTTVVASLTVKSR